MRIRPLRRLVPAMLKLEMTCFLPSAAIIDAKKPPPGA
jgi:hypothetical protein